MSSMLVCYGEKSNDSDLNRYFGKVILHLLEIESLQGRQLKQWCIDKMIELPEPVWDSPVDTLQQLSLFKFILCLQFSNQQLENHTGEIFEEKQLLWADIRIEPLKFDDLYNLNGEMDHNYEDPLTKYALELYTANLFLKCGTLYHVKDFIQHCTASKQKMNSLTDKRETFPELFDTGKQSVIKIPWKFPTQFLTKVTEEHTLNSKVSISFSKMMLKERAKLYKDINPEDISPRYVKVDMKWLEGTNVYSLWQMEEETSQTSLELEEIKQRQIERQKIFEDDLEPLTPKTDVDMCHLYLKSTKNKNFSNNHAIDDKILGKDSVRSTVADINMGKENYSMESEDSESIRTALAFQNGMVTGLENPTSLKNLHIHETAMIDMDLCTGLRHLTYVPKFGDVHEADCIIKIEINKPGTTPSSLDSISLTQQLQRLRCFFKREKAEKTLEPSKAIKTQNDNLRELLLPPIDSKITFKKFFRAKLRQIRSDFSYYKKVAIYCIDDIRHYSPDEEQHTP